MSDPVKEPILDPEYWRIRLAEVQGDPTLIHHAVFRCSLETWRAIEEKHRLILLHYIGINQSVLDAGCGWGRLLDLMPPVWRGWYVGVDLSPDFIELARRLWKNRQHKERAVFFCTDLRDLGNVIDINDTEKIDWAVLVSIRPMIKRHLGDEVWGEIEERIRKVSKRLLYLEYDANDEGSVE